MLCTLVIAIGTFPHALRAVEIPWSLDRDMSHFTLDIAQNASLNRLFRMGESD